MQHNGVRFENFSNTPLRATVKLTVFYGARVQLIACHHCERHWCENFNRVVSSFSNKLSWLRFTI